MNKLKLSTALDGLFIFGISFFIFYALIKQKIYSVYSTTILSVILSASISFFFIVVISYKNRKKTDIDLQNKKIQAFKEYLYFLQDDEIIKLISSYLDKAQIEYQVKNNGFYLKNEKIVLFFTFSPDLISLTTCINFYKQTPKNYKTAILLSNYDGKVKDFSPLFEKVKLYSVNDFYNGLKENNLLPYFEIPSIKKNNFSKLISSFLVKGNVKKFFLWGAVLTLFSTVTYYKVFYALLGTAFLLIAVYLKFFAKKT